MDRLRFTQLALAGAALVTAACDVNYSAIDPTRGHDRALVTVVGPPVVLGVVLWDAETPAEQFRPSSPLTRIFTVPGGAAVGPHAVERYQAGLRGTQGGSPATFTVDENRTFPMPRVDRISLAASVFIPGNKILPLLYVQGANVDVGSVVEILGADGVTWTPMPTMADKAITNRYWDESLAISHAAMAYPIYHFIAFIAAPGEQTAGSMIRIRIRNEDDVPSDPASYTFAATQATLDSDGDDIPDDWEKSGLDGTGQPISLPPGEGLNYLRPDLLLEVDYMFDPASALVLPWSGDIAQTITGAFAAAPIINPRGASGIHLVIDASQAIPKKEWVYFYGNEDTTIPIGSCTAGTLPAYPSFKTIKRACFDNTRRGRLYHYCVWGGYTQIYNTLNGVTEIIEPGGLSDWGDDCEVFTQAFLPARNHTEAKAELLMHELGHDLLQYHGGATVDLPDDNPTYNSIMNGSWLGRGRWGGTSARKMYPVCTPLYYRMAGAVEISGNVPTTADLTIMKGFSDGMGRVLDESNLDETMDASGNPFGVCNNATDWNGNGNANQVDLAHDIDGGPVTQHRDFANWTSLVYTGPRLNGVLKLAGEP